MMAFLRQTFVNPQILPWMALLAVPLIIHLINRQRYQRRRWAAMEFLLRALRRHQRKLQMQNLLLLLIRIAILALLVLALARPVLRQGALSAASDGKQNWIVAVDVSYSMGFQEDSLSLFDHARENVLGLVDVLLKPGDRVALMTLERTPRVLLPPVTLSDDGKQRFVGELESLELTTEGMDLGAFFAALDELAGRFVTPLGDPEPKRLVLFSDFQRKDWMEADGAPVPGVLQYIEKFQSEGGEFAFARMSFRSRPNLAITELSASPALVAADVWTEFRVTVRNFGEQDIDNVDLTLQIDRDPDDTTLEPQLGDVVNIPAGGTLTRVLPYRFTTPGYHTAAAELRSDGLRIDNRRFLTLPVAESVRVLLVDGDPVANPIDRETFHLEVALGRDDEPGAETIGRHTPFVSDVVTFDQLGDVDLEEYSLVVLANVSDIAADLADAVKGYVRSGGALMVFLGGNVRPEFYNSDFDELLPASLGEIRGDTRYPVYLEPGDKSHPVVKYFEEHREVTHLERPVIAFYRYFQLTGLQEDGVRVVFRFSDSLESPAVLDCAAGEGRVLWMLSTADQEWNEFPTWPDFVVFLYEAATYLVNYGMSSSNLVAGETFRRTYPGSSYAEEVTLLIPESPSGGLQRSRSVRKAMRSLEGGSDFELTHEDTAIPGLYRLDLLRPGTPGTDTTEYFAVNLETSESDLRPINEEELQASYENLRYRSFDASARIQEAEGKRELLRGNEFWRWVAYAVVALVLGETLLAFLFGRRFS